MRDLRRLRSGSALAATLVLAAAAGLAYQLKYSSQNKVLHWQYGFTTLYTDPFNLHTGTNEGSGFRQAVGTWNTVAGSAFRFSGADASHAPWGSLPVNDGFNDIQLINLSLGSGTLAAAYTLASFSYEDSTGFNLDTDVDFTTTEVYDFQSVALHEQGHVLGLAHTNDSTAVMATYYTGILRTLQPDDINGVKALYPVIVPGGGGTPPVIPNGLPVLGAPVTGISLSSETVKLGSPVDLACTIANGTDDALFLQALYTEPSAVAPFNEVTVPAHSDHQVAATLIVSEVPGVYTVRCTFHGLDATHVYRAVGQGASQVTVTRDDIPVSVGDRLAASLGPSGVDRVGALLPKGTKVSFELRGDADNGMLPLLDVLDPEGIPVKWAPGRIVKAKAAGIHVLRVSNATANRGRYTLFTEPRGPVKVPAAAGLLPEGGTETEVPMTLLARTAGTLAISGSKKLGLRITGLVSPSGEEMEIEPGAAVTVPSLGEDGTWTVRVDGTAGLPGKFKVAFKGEWLPGKSLTE